MTCRVLLLLSVSMLATTPASAEPQGVPLKDAVPHLTTTGEASVEIMPDQADLNLGVTQERKTADEASDATARAATAVIAVIKARGVEPGDIHTSFSLSQTFDPKKDEKGNVVGRTLRGYEADEHIAVRVHDIAKVGPLARELVASGANTFQGLAFSLSKEKQKRRDLATEAMRDALVQAKIYTDAVGLKLGRVLQIGEDAGGARPVYAAADMPLRRVAAASAGAVVIPVEPGLQHLSESVTVIWEIEGQAK